MNTRQGLQPGAPMDNDGNILFTDEVAAKIAASGVGWVRLNFRLGPRLRDWKDSVTLGFSALSRYETIVDTALKHNLKILGLLCNEACNWQVSEDEWRANSAEKSAGNGDNAYIREFAAAAVGVVVPYFSGKIEQWQIWNEPNCTVTWLYPSNFAWLLSRSYIAARDSRAPNVKIVSGGLLSTHSMSSTTLTPDNTGASYLAATYQRGVSLAAWAEIKREYGSYPLDAIGQHLYIDQWTSTSAARIEQAVSMVRSAYTAAEGNRYSKPIYITEVGWNCTNVTEKMQAANLRTAFLKLKTMPCTPVSYWFFLRDETAMGLKHGLLRDDGSEKPAWQMYKEMNDVHVFPEPQEVVTDPARGLRLRRPVLRLGRAAS
jgi:hypothetical protein